MYLPNQIDGFLHDQDLHIERGDIMLLFTDGITEATNKKGEMFGQVKLEQTLDQYADLPVSRIVEKVINEVNNFQREQADDMTVVVIKKN